MIELQRKSYRYLLQWKEKDTRKPLIIRGARQVGKSTLVSQFSKEYTHFLSLNLEKPQHREKFESIDDTQDLLNALFFQFNIPLNGEKTLIFIDEIQESPKAIWQLRYFYEEFPHLHIIAAGSLLEFALSDIPSFPVGRVEQFILHPFDFEEFLMALNHEQALKAIKEILIPDYTHQTLIDLFHDYCLIGGMPEVVKHYVKKKSTAGLKNIYDNIWQGYVDDVEKYAQNTTEKNIIRHIIDKAPYEKDRISFANFGNSNYKSREVGESLRALDLARIIQLIYPTTDVAVPTVPDLKRKPRLQFLDTGLLNHSLGIQAEMIGVKDFNDFHKGKIIQHLITQQIQAQEDSPRYKPLFWVRENANSNAEVDLVIQYQSYVIPVEVKSGAQGTLRSLHQFVERSEHPYAIRLLANKFSIEEAKTPAGTPYLLMNLPYYLASEIENYAEWFIENY